MFSRTNPVTNFTNIESININSNIEYAFPSAHNECLFFILCATTNKTATITFTDVEYTYLNRLHYTRGSYQYYVYAYYLKSVTSASKFKAVSSDNLTVDILYP